MRRTLSLTLLLTALVEFAPPAAAAAQPDAPRPTAPERFLRLTDLRSRLTKGTQRDDRLAALRGLLLVRPPAVEAVPDLLGALDDRDEFVRAYAALTLLFVDQRHSKAGLAVLTPLFADKAHPPPVLRETSLFLELAQVRPAHPDLVVGLLALLHGDHPLGQFAASQALRHVDPTAKDTAAPLRAALTDPLPRVRLVAAEGLVRVAPQDKEKVVATLDALLTVPEKGVRGDAAVVLARLDPARTGKAVRALRPLLQDPAFKPGRTLARQLLELDFGQADVAVPLLAQGLADADRKTRLSAVRDLAACGRLAVAQEPALRRCLDDPDPEVGRAAAEALLLARPQLARSLLPDVLGRERENARFLSLLDSLKDVLPEDEVVANLAKTAEEKGTIGSERHLAITRLHALSRLAGFGPDAHSAVPALLRLLAGLADPEQRERVTLGEPLAAQTVYVLGRIGPRAAPAVPALLKMARGPRNAPALRVEAAAALKLIDPDAAALADIP